MIAVAFTLAQLADFITSNVTTEFHPVGSVLLTTPLLAFAAKTALVALCCSIASIVNRKHRYLGHGILVFGTLAGLVGTLSNLP